MQDTVLKSILDKLSASLKNVYGSKLKTSILYGSVARGTATQELDIDIMVLVDSSTEELKKYADKLCDVSTDFALEYFKVFSNIDVCYAEFNEWKQVLPFCLRNGKTTVRKQNINQLIWENKGSSKSFFFDLSYYVSIVFADEMS